MGPSPTDEEDWRKAVIAEVDAVLRRGEQPDPETFAARWPDEADRVRTIVEIRRSLFAEGVLDEAAGEGEPEPEPEGLLGAPAKDRDHALADIKNEFQDAVNRGDRPDVHGVIDERPELKDEVAELSQFYNFLTDALKPEFTGPAPEPVQEVVLSHFRLVTMHAKHPLGGLFLGVDQHTNRHAELLVIRGRMSKARSTRLVREALAAREIADPGLVPVIDAGEVHDLRFIAWEYRSELTLERIIRRLRRGGGRRVLSDVLAEHSDSGRIAGDLRAPQEEDPFEVPDDDAASKLRAIPTHVAGVLDLVASAAEALDRAHLRGHIHADVRPANVFVDRAGRARLRGLGLVQNARAAWHRLGSDITFLAPEVLADDEPPLDWRADVWGVAVLLYSLLALADPPDFSAIEERAERLFVDLRGAPEGLLPLLDSALARDPASRPPSCGVIAAELRQMSARLRPEVPDEDADPPVPPWIWYLLLIVILVAVLTVVLWSIL
jgi:hypothetical protein